ncbi:MAG: hypothetical protein ACLFU8_06165 [Anaerolineales bacterium]
MILRITDGTTTVNLTGGSDGIYGGAEYVPRTPDVSEMEFTAEALRDGGELIQATRRNVVESLLLVLTGASRSALESTLHDLERLLEGAARYQERKVGARVYVEYRKADSGDVYRSEILRGSVQPSEETAGEAYFAAGAIQVTVAWKRRFYWEGPESELSLTNAHGSGVSGITVYNHYDSGNENFVAIDGDDVDGVLPAGCRLVIMNTYNDTSRLGDVIIAHNIFSYPTTLDHVLEGEDADYVAGGASAAPASPDVSTYSAGQYQPVSWTGDTLTQAIRWQLSAALLSACAGGWFRLWGRFTTSPSGTKITPRITFPSGTPLTVVAEAAEVTLGSGTLQDLGVLQIPPWLPAETDLQQVDLTLYARETGGGSFNLDFLQLTPLDGYRYLYPRGYGSSYERQIVDDSIHNVLYTENYPSGGVKTGHYLGRGNRILLWPGRDQRLYFLATNWTGGAEVLRTLGIRVYYRPRRLTL